MPAIDLPVRNDLPHYTFDIELEQRSYSFEFRWNDRAAAWFFSLFDGDGVELLSGRRVSVGFPLLYRFADPRLPSGYMEAVDTTGAGLDPGIADLGGRVKLLYYDSTDTLADLA